MPQLDNRLKSVASQIRSHTHVDIGSDHGHLLVALLKAGRIDRGIAIENKRQPFENSVLALAGLRAELRFADGLEGLRVGEADSLSICGMGGESIVKILDAYPDRVTPTVILQPNRKPELVRDWGIRNGFHLLDECVADGHWMHQILRFQRSEIPDDPAYQGLDHHAALLFGPLMLKRWEPSFVRRLREERAYFRRFDRLSDESASRLAAIERVL